MKRLYRRLGRWIRKNRTLYSVLSFGLVLCVILPATIVLFPESTNLGMSILIVILALLDELKDLADQIEDDYEENQT